jgi:hypothetical protein
MVLSFRLQPIKTHRHNAHSPCGCPVIKIKQLKASETTQMMNDQDWKGSFGEGSKVILPGVHGINQRKARPASTGSMVKFTRFDPINSTLIHSLTPQLPPVYESINPARRMDFRQRDVQ